HLIVERLAGIADEDGRYAECATDDEGGAARVPRGVATGLEGAADAAAGKAAGVRLLLHQLAAVELLDAAPSADGLEEGVVLFRAEAGERLEPVGIVGGTLGRRPFLHAAGHLVGQLAADLRPLDDGLADSVVGILGEELAHGVLIEHALAEV